MRGDAAVQQSVLHAPPWSSPLEPQQRMQPLCSDREGWGPISNIRYDLTPCFLDLTVLFAACWGILLGLAAVWYLLKKRIPHEVSRNWHFYAKLYVSITVNRILD